MWWAEPEKYNVLPLDDRISLRLLARETKEQTSYTHYAGAVRIPQGSAPNTKNRSHRVAAEVEIPASGAEGPICAMGGASSRWSLYVKDRKFVYCYNYIHDYYFVRSINEVPTGEKVSVGFEFEKTGQKKFGASGMCRLYINDNKVGKGQIPRTVRYIYAIYETFDIGLDSGTPVTNEYKQGARFNGKIEKVVIDLLGDRHIDPEAKAKIAMKRQ
jgi:hypothetical protein